ncbi:unnamed protein product [Urochloa humidicola]
MSWVPAGPAEGGAGGDVPLQGALPVFLIWLVTLCSTLPIQMLFPFLYFMIRDLHNIARDEKDIGFYAGFVGASFMAGRGSPL